MSSARYPAAQGERDVNHAELAKVYEELFCSVIDTHALGFGFPDLVVGFAGQTELVEVKTEKGKATPAQERFTRDWRGSKVRIVRNRQEVVEHVLEVRRRAAFRPA
jgi:hypothetical protein